MSEGVSIFLTLPTDRAPSPPVEGSRKDTCDDCGDEVWVSPRADEEAQLHKMRFVCLDCIDPYIDDALEEHDE